MSFNFEASTANAVFYRSYSRRQANGYREDWNAVTERTLQGLIELGNLRKDEIELIRKMQNELKAMPSGRWLWVGGTEWSKQPKNYSGGYNCSSTDLVDWKAFGLIMSLAMQGCGTGAIIEDKYISQLPVIKNTLKIEIIGEIGKTPKEYRVDSTTLYKTEDQTFLMSVGDSRNGWVKAYQSLLEISSDEFLKGLVNIKIDVSDVRTKGEKLKGFGGTANPVKLPEMFLKVGNILNKAALENRQLTSIECCLILDEAAVTIVAGNIRRSASIRQFSSNDTTASVAKDNLWQQDSEGNWKIDPERDALRMANHTRVFHHKPSFEECLESATKQFYSGEGAIQWAGEAIARSNADLLNDSRRKQAFLDFYQSNVESAKSYLRILANNNVAGISEKDLEHRMGRYGLNPCLSGDMRLLTVEGYQKIEDLVDTEPYIINAEGEVSKSKVWCSGEKATVKLSLTTHNHIVSTPDHRFLTLEGEFEAQQCKGKQLMPYLKTPEHDSEFIALGYIQGDGTTTKIHDVNNQIFVNVGRLDHDILPKFEHLDYEWGRDRMIKIADLKPTLVKYGFEAKILPERSLPSQYFKWSKSYKAAFLNGLYSANGCVIKGGRISFKTTCETLAQQLKNTLEEDFGIVCYITTNKPRKVTFSNGVYQCRESFDVNIQDYCSRLTFFNHINFSLNYRTEKLADALLRSAPTVRAVLENGVRKVYDFTEPLTHWGVVEGVVTHNCGEIIGKNLMCNLSEIHLNNLDPWNFEEQTEAFKAGGIAASVLLHHKFEEPRYQYSREIDPIVAVSFTGLFDFFVKALGADWLRWWEAGRPEIFEANNYAFNTGLVQAYETFGLDVPMESISRQTWNIAPVYKEIERAYLEFWKETAFNAVNEYCDRNGLKRPNRYTALQPAGCLDKTALRIFDQGLLYADEIVSEGSGESEGIDLSVRNGISTNKAIANQPLNLVKVTLANGRTLRMTPNHRLSIDGKWVYAEDMKPGMKIDYSIGQYSKTENISLIPVDYSDYTREARVEERGHGRGVLSQTIKTPSIVTPDLGYFLGCLFGNGCLSPSNTRVRFSHGSVSVLDKLQEIGKNLFGIRGLIAADGAVTKYELTFSSKQLFDWLLINGLVKTTKSNNLDRIPYAVRSSSKETILAFFCGLIDTDGCVRKEGSVSIDSASEDFIRNLQQIGEAVGFSFFISHNTQGQNHQAEKDMWSLGLSRVLSTKEALDYIGANSLKCLASPLPAIKITHKRPYYKIEKVEFETTPDYSYDFAVDGVDDNDSWYWQGALKSHNSKSLLTGASSGFAPPKAARYIRRITFAKDDAIALALMDYGYSVVPSQSDKDENGNLLNDPFDSRCTEWLVEIPVATSWSDLPGCDQIDISKFSIEAQFDFLMQVQKHYVSHNSSATLEIREHEIEPLAKLIYNAIQNDEGYISSAVLARFDSLETFPRLPFEPISKEVYEKLSQDVLNRRKGEDFLELLSQYDNQELSAFNQGAAACDSDKCLLPLADPNKTKEFFTFKGFEPLTDAEEVLLAEEARKRLEGLL